jgi:glyoxylase-like metal-dependent hydrolase (beta-lactamase superfamily II)
MLVKHFVFGPIETNCYLVACEKTRDAMVVDPDVRTKEEKDKLSSAINKPKIKLRYIVNTHHHSDHTSGNGMLKKATGAEILIHELDAAVLPKPWEWWSKMIKTDPQRPCPACGNEGSNHVEILNGQEKAVLSCNACGLRFEIFASPPADRLLYHGDVIIVGELEFVVIHTPGHSAGGISLYSKKEKAVFTGDTLFKGSVGRTDTIDSSCEDIIRSVKELSKLPEDTVVYPGHGETTTISEEKCNNPFLQN